MLKSLLIVDLKMELEKYHHLYLSKAINEEVVGSMIWRCFFFNGGELFEWSRGQNLLKKISNVKFALYIYFVVMGNRRIIEKQELKKRRRGKKLQESKN